MVSVLCRWGLLLKATLLYVGVEIKLLQIVIGARASRGSQPVLRRAPTPARGVRIPRPQETPLSPP